MERLSKVWVARESLFEYARLNIEYCITRFFLFVCNLHTVAYLPFDFSLINLVHVENNLNVKDFSSEMSWVLSLS